MKKGGWGASLYLENSSKEPKTSSKSRTYYVSNGKEAIPGDTRLLTSADGFPWCEIPEELFTARGINFRKIDRQEIDWILSKGITLFYDELMTPSLAINRFKPLFMTGMYIGEEPIGFSYGGLLDNSLYQLIDDEGNPIKQAERGLLHMRPDKRGGGMGRILFAISTLQLLAENPDEIFTYLADKTGAMEHILKSHGFKFTGTYKSENPRFSKPLRTMEARHDFQLQLAESIITKL
jgi:hypothetical protein